MSVCVSNTAISATQSNCFGNIGNEYNPLNSNITAHEAKTNTSTDDPNDMPTISYDESFDSDPSWDTIQWYPRYYPLQELQKLSITQTPAYTIPISTASAKETAHPNVINCKLAHRKSHT